MGLVSLGFTVFVIFGRLSEERSGVTVVSSFSYLHSIYILIHHTHSSTCINTNGNSRPTYVTVNVNNTVNVRNLDLSSFSVSLVNVSLM
jgi:hypothetical protein